MKIDLWFPIPIYIEENILDNNENKKLCDKILELKNQTEPGGRNWLCDTYNTLGSVDIINNECFSLLLDKTTHHVNNFAKQFNSTETYECKEFWGNVYGYKDYQEYHIHSHSTFSAVYFAKCPEGSGDLIFENPFSVDMYEMKNISENNQFTYKNCSYSAVENRLIIFRSHLKHMVRQGFNKDYRISFAFNF